MTAIDNIVVPKITVAIRALNASFERNVTRVMANSESREHIGIIAPFENAYGFNNVQQMSSRNDELEIKFPTR